MLEVRAARHGDAPALDALGAAPEAGVFVLKEWGRHRCADTSGREIFGCAVAPECADGGMEPSCCAGRCAPPGRGRFILKRRRAMPRWRRCCAGAGFAHRSRHCPPQGKSPPAREKPAPLPAL